MQPSPAVGRSGCGAWKPQNSRRRSLSGRVTVVDVQGFRLKAAVPVRESRFPTPGFRPVVPFKGIVMNFLFDGRMDVNNLPDEIRRVVSLLVRAGTSHVFQVRLQLRLLDHDDELLVHPDHCDLRDLMHVPPLKEVLTNDLEDGFDNSNIDVSADIGHALNRRQHISIMRNFTGEDRGPPTIQMLLHNLES